MLMIAFRSDPSSGGVVLTFWLLFSSFFIVRILVIKNWATIGFFSFHNFSTFAPYLIIFFFIINQKKHGFSLIEIFEIPIHCWEQDTKQCKILIIFVFETIFRQYNIHTGKTLIPLSGLLLCQRTLFHTTIILLLA